MTEFKPTPEEIEAGVESLNAFGGFGRVVSLTETKGGTLEYWLRMDAQTVYTLFLYDAERALVRENLQEIMRNKKQ